MSTLVSAVETLRLWETRAVSEISSKISLTEAENLKAERLRDHSYIYPFDILNTQVKKYDEFLIDLANEIEQHPNGVLTTASPDVIEEEQKLTVNLSKKPTIFIVHGHDEINLHKLEKLLVSRFKLDCKILSLDPNVGRTLIEKLEQEGKKVDFAFVLLTPDDQIKSQGLEYKQARPNVIFELGWFYGKLGREKVCVLKRKDTNVHSDLSGVVWIEFNEYVNEKIEEIERELIAGGLLNS